MKELESIYRHFSKDLKRFILSRTGEEALSEDLLHEAFIRIHANIGNLRDETKVQSWVYQVTRNVINDHFRKANSRNNELPEMIEEDKQVEDEIMTEAVEDMIKMMDGLPAEYCEALCLTELEGLSQKEYAERLGISYSGAKSRVQRARHQLRDMLMKCCHYEFDKYGTVIGIHPADCCCCSNH